MLTRACPMPTFVFRVMMHPCLTMWPQVLRAVGQWQLQWMTLVRASPFLLTLFSLSQYPVCKYINFCGLIMGVWQDDFMNQCCRRAP